ncbi:PAS domain S-box protein [Azospirillum halopraeferens]|uniref:PAS domain S-box protein n=1 Tax=Azospirillum halopraeferens TaxID=34010 RepID=UPI0004247289|nr:PAS domain S-box protein [Azospirillum halopraeferens]
MPSTPDLPDRLQACLRHQRLLTRFGTQALAEPDLPTLLREAAERIAEGLETTFAKIMQRRPEHGDLLVVAGVGWASGVVGRATVPDDPATAAGCALARDEPVAVADLRAPSAELHRTDLLREHGIVAVLNVPIDGDGGPWGVVEADSREPRAFREDEVLFVRSIANLLSAAVARVAAREREHLERARLDAVLAQMPAGVAIAEAPSGRLLMHNARAIALLGHPMLDTDSYEGYARYGALHPDGTPYAPAEYPIARAVMTGETVELEPMLYRRGDGRLTHLLVSAAPVHDAAGTRVLAVSTFHATDEERRLEEEQRRIRDALAESEARYRAAFEQAAVGLAEIAGDGWFLAANGRLRSILGYGRDELATLRLQDIMHPDDRPVAAAFTRRLYAGELPAFTMETRLRCKDGGVVWASLSTAPVAPPGRPPYTVAVVQDVSDRKRAEAEREELLVQKDLLMREMNHRIKNSLQMVAALVMLQASNRAGGDTDRRFEETAARIATIALIHERLYRTEIGADVDAAAYLADLGRDLAQTLGLPPGHLTVDAVAAHLPADVMAPLGLIVNELVTNAVKYAYAGQPPGAIRVTLDRAGGGRLRLAVEDDGAGLPEGFTISGSAGLGMRVLQSLAQQLRADLRIPPTAGGARFEIVLPAGG